MALPHVGEYLTDRAQFDEFPIGGRFVDEDSDYEWTKTGEQVWIDSDGDTCATADLHFHSVLRVTHLPETTTGETLAQYQHRYLETIRRGVEINSIRQSILDHFMTEMGLVDAEPGTGMLVRSLHTFARLPDGTIVHVGDPDDYRVFGVFVKRDGRWVRLLGGQTREPGPMWSAVVDRVAGEVVRPDWLTRSGDAIDMAEVLAFKKKAYYAGRHLKSEHGWCNAYEAIVAEAGIDGSIA